MSTQLAFHCPHCRQPVPASPARLGQVMACPSCRQEFRLTPANMGGAGSAPAAPMPPANPPGSAPMALPPHLLPPGSQPSQTAQPGSLPNPAAAAPMAMPPMAPPPAQGAAPQSNTARFKIPIAPPQPAGQPVPLPAAPPPGRPPAPVMQPQPGSPPAPVQPKKAAKFIAPAAATTTIALTAEGKLPDLHLSESAASAKAAAKKRESNPLILVAVVFMSVAMTLIMLFVDPNAKPHETDVSADAHQSLEAFYQNARGPLQPYQILLRDAQRAHTRGEASTEKKCYHKVMDLLRAESKDKFRGLTGTVGRDQELELLLTRLLSELD